MKTETIVYVVTMYRYGDREKHSYVTGVFSDPDLARRSGYDEEFVRGGKYKAEVTTWVINEPIGLEKEIGK